MDDLSRAVELLRALVAMDTTPEHGTAAVAAFLAERLEGAGARVEVMPSPDGRDANVFATVGPETSGGIVLSGHTDVVPAAGQAWSSDPFTLEERDGRLYGRGSCDMKGFVAAATAMAPLLRDAARTRPVHFSFTHSEELGCVGAQQLAGVLAQRDALPSAAIVGEPTNMGIIDAHKGCFQYVTHFDGLPGHGSEPDLGVNAVEYAARYVALLVSLKGELKARVPADSPFNPKWTTINVGRFDGGTADNVIAGSARVEWEMRPVQDPDAALVKARLAELCGNELLPEMRAVCPDAAIRTEIVGEIAGLGQRAENEARDLLMGTTGNTATDTVSFGTEAGIFQQLGMCVAICGPGDIAQAHKADEYLEASQLSACLKSLRGLAATVADAA